MYEMKIILLLLAAGLLTPAIASPVLKTGDSAPDFKVASGSGKEISLSMLKGNVITIFYETKEREVIEKNRDLKNMLNRFYETQPDLLKNRISRLAIINCSGSRWPFNSMWKNRLIENSRKEGITIYGDWDGNFAGDYNVVEEESNFIIIDKKGSIRYFRAGKIDLGEFEEIKALLSALLLY